MTTATLAGMLFCLLALALPSVVRGQATCLGITCVTGANSCDANQRCQCDAGLVGDGRTKCTTNKCVCSSVADPHFSLYDDANPDVTANLQCTYQLDSYSSGSACNLAAVFIDTEPRGTGNEANFRVFASSVRASMFVNFNPVNLEVDATTSGTVNADGFTTATQTECGLEIGYNDTYGAVYLSIPTTASHTNPDGSVCGDCDGTGDEAPGTTPQEHLSYILKRLAAGNQQQGTYSTQCTNIYTAAQSCSDANIDIAGEVCYPYISKPFGLCLLDNSQSGVTSYSVIMDKFTSCVQSVCGGSVTAACTALNNDANAAGPCDLSPVPSPCIAAK